MTQWAFPSATKVIRSALGTFQPCGYSICHNANNINHIKNKKIMCLFHLPQVVITSAITHVVILSATIGNNISQHISGYSNCHTILLINTCGNSICHNDNHISHLYKVTVSSATVETSAVTQNGFSISIMTNNISHKNVAIPSATKAIPSAIKSGQKAITVAKNICHQNI